MFGEHQCGLEAQEAIRRAGTTIEEEGRDHYLEEAYPTYVAGTSLQDKALERTFVDMAQCRRWRGGLVADKGASRDRNTVSEPRPDSWPDPDLAGREDQRTIPGAHQRLNQEMSGSKLMIIEDAGHLAPIE